jgi:hypothetical protein
MIDPVKLWKDVGKFLNTELLQSMVSFDPTAVHKKIRFKRAKRIMKCRRD